MFSLASYELQGRRILVIEREDAMAAEMRRAILSEFGTPLGPASTLEEAFCYLATTGKVDSVMMDIRLATSTVLPVPAMFKERGVETIFVTSHDDWFDGDEDGIDFAAGHWLQASA